MGLLIKFSIGFAIVGLIISLAFGVIGGNRPVHIATTALVCTILAGAIGAGVCRFIEMKVPELL